MDSIFTDGNLTFAGQDVECIPPWLASKYGQNTIRLDLSYNRLRSSKGLTGFENINELILDNNLLADEQVEFPTMPDLQTLTMNKNNLKNLEVFINKIVEKLPSLRYLSLLGNEACPNQLSSLDKDEEDYQRYRYYVLYRLPQLKFLDSSAVTDAERAESMRVGQYTKIITTPLEDCCDEGIEPECNPDTSTTTAGGDTGYTPLPTSSAIEGTHRSSYGKVRYKYFGKHSEGNRFISDDDL